MHVSPVNARLRPTPWALLTLVFVISLPAVTARFYAADEIEYFAYLRSIWFDGDLSFDNEYRYFYERGIAQGKRARPDGGYYGDRFYATFLAGTTATGLRTNFAPVGSAILWSPFYGVTDVGVRLARAFGREIPADGLSAPYISAVTYASAVYGFLALVLAGLTAERLAGVGLGPVLAVWLGTPLLFYMYVAPGFSHACSAFAVAAFVALWLHVRGTWSIRGVAALGAWAALMGMVREQDLFIALGPALDFVVTSARSRGFGVPALRAIMARATVGLATFAVCFLPQIASYLVLFGRPAPSPSVERKMTWTSPNAWLVLASPENGWLFWTPLTVAALVGLVWLAADRVQNAPPSQIDPRERSWIGVVCLFMVATQIYIGGSLDTWAGAGSFGQRRLIGLTVFLVIGLASLAVRMKRGWQTAALRVFVALAVWWNIALTAQFGSGLMDRQHLSVGRNAYHTFVTVPHALPALAYRYITDRQSFYESHPSVTP
jgi:hypothetical protein